MTNRECELSLLYAIILGDGRVQRARKRFVNLAKQDPGRAQLNRQATAGTNFTKPRTSHFRDLCTCAANTWYTILAPYHATH